MKNTKYPISLCRTIILCLLFTALPVTLTAQAPAYEVEIQGIKDKEVLNALKNASLCIILQKKPLVSMQILKKRARSDVEKFTEIAKYHGYYSAEIFFVVKHTETPQVIYQVDLGRKYRLSSFEIITEEGPLTSISLESLNLQLDQPISTQAIIDAEKIVITNLKKEGYAACQAVNKEVIADVSKETLAVRLEILKGPLLSFGALQINGNTTVRTQAIVKQLLWKEGDRFDPQKVTETQIALEKTGLFSSVVISEELASINDHTLPMTLQLQEGKHRSIGAGLSYTTSFGPGVRAEWENRNFRGKGDRFTFRTEVLQKYQTVLLSLTQPNFHRADQDLIWVLEYDKLHTVAFDSRSYNGSSLVQRRLNKETEVGIGARFEWLHSRNFEGSNIYYLAKAPLQCKWSNANSLLDPTKGQTLNVKVTPTAQLFIPSFMYTLHTTSLSTYHSLPSNRLTMAAKAVVGNIIGAARHTIPSPDRFYGGSENVLRGYRAYTVSPLHDRRIPIGGRSLLAGSLEARFRSTKELGWVLFYDIGNVYGTNFPRFPAALLHSIGTGVRYATPIGPLRFDIAVPLHRRSKIDPYFQIYFSIGQSF